MNAHDKNMFCHAIKLLCFDGQLLKVNDINSFHSVYSMQGVQLLFFPSFWTYSYLGEAQICNKIENGIIVVCVLEWDLS